MQQEIDAVPPSVPVTILGVNKIGAEAQNDAVTSTCDIPWLQDEPGEDAWTSWNGVHGDVFVLDGNNEIVTIYSVEQNDLAEPANYDALKNALLDAAAAEGN